MHRNSGNGCRSSVGKSERKSFTTSTLRHKREDNIKQISKKWNSKDVELIKLVRTGIQWQVRVSSLILLEGNFLTVCSSMSFSRRTLLHEDRRQLLEVREHGRFFRHHTTSDPLTLRADNCIQQMS